VRRRLILAAAYLLLVVIVGLAVPFGTTLARRLTQELGQRVEREAFTVGAAVEDRLELRDRSALQAMVVAFGNQIGGRVLLTDASGVLLADSLQTPGSPAPSYASRPEIALALTGEPNWEVRGSASLGHDILVSAVPVVSAGSVLGVVRISYPMASVQAAIHRSWAFLAAVGVAALLAGLVLAWFLARWLARPLGEAAAVARRIAGGELGARVPDAGPPEVRELGRDMNLMAERLADRARSDREFASNAAHQLRTPLTSLRLSLEEALSAPDPSAEIGHALKETDRLAGVVDALLALGRARGEDAGPVDLAAVARSIAGWLARDGVSVEVDAGEDGQARADPGRAREVVRNLMENAMRFARTSVRVSVEREDGRVRVRVEDDGPGVPEGERSRVFDRFYRGPNPGGPGSGLGLAVAGALAEADGAHLRVASSPLGGASFEASYPATEEG
jgi:signal transduction histidine kinase